MLPLVTNLDGDAVQCALECLDGTCTEPTDCQAHNVGHVVDFIQTRIAQGCPCCAVQDVKAEAKKLKNFVGGKTAAGALDWRALLQAFLTLLLQILTPVAQPQPAPAKP